MYRRSLESVRQDPTFSIVVFGCLCEIALLYMSFSQVPEEYLFASHELATLQATAIVLPPAAILLLGILYLSQQDIIRELISNYAICMTVLGIFWFTVSIVGGHAFGGLIGLGLLSKWALLVIGSAHVGLKLRRI